MCGQMKNLLLIFFSSTFFILHPQIFLVAKRTLFLSFLNDASQKVTSFIAIDDHDDDDTHTMSRK
jgi:hypothetical protein